MSMPKYCSDCGERFEHEEWKEGVHHCSNCGTDKPILLDEEEYEEEFDS